MTYAIKKVSKVVSCLYKVEENVLMDFSVCLHINLFSLNPFFCTVQDKTYKTDKKVEQTKAVYLTLKKKH